MKKYSFLIYIVLPVFLMLGVNSCIEDTDGTPTIKAGELKVAGIFPDSAAGGELVVVKGAGLGDIRSVVLDNGSIPVGFQPTLNTADVFMFRVPLDANGGPQNVVLTNGGGIKTNVAFRVLAFPVVNTVSNYNFESGTEITITGNNLHDVTAVTLTDGGQGVTVVSKTKTELVLKFPASTVSRSTLKIVNSTGAITTTQEFVNLSKAFVIFGEKYGEGFADGSWGDPGTITDKEAKSGTKSVFKNYQKGNWHLINFANWYPGVKDDGYKYLSFWVKGGSQDLTIYLTSDKRKAGFGNGDRSTPVNVKANTWTYFKIPMAEARLFETGDTFFQLGFWIPGPDGQDEVFHFDDLILIK